MFVSSPVSSVLWMKLLKSALKESRIQNNPDKALKRVSIHVVSA